MSAKKQDSLRAIKILKLESSLTSFVLFMPLMWLFFRSIGLNQFQIAMTQAIFAATMLLLEVPTGYFADRVSRRISNSSGDLFMALALIVYFFANSFWIAVLAEVIGGIGLSLSSGADSALMRAHCKVAKVSYKEQSARLTTIGFTAVGIGSIIGGLIGAYSIRLTFLIQAAIFLIAGLLALTIKEAGERRVSEHNPIKDIWLITKYCLHGHKELAWRIFASSFLMISTMFVVWFLTPMFLEAGIKVKFHGILFAAISVAAVLGSELVKRHIKLNILLPFLICTLVYSILSISISAATILLFLLTSLARGINSARVAPFIQEKAGEDIQATAVSVYRMIYKLAGTLLLPLVNYFGKISLQYGLLASAVICLLAFILFKLNEKKFA